mgnify:CR=1 FL=1
MGTHHSIPKNDDMYFLQYQMADYLHYDEPHDFAATTIMPRKKNTHFSITTNSSTFKNLQMDYLGYLVCNIQVGVSTIAAGIVYNAIELFFINYKKPPQESFLAIDVKYPLSLYVNGGYKLVNKYYPVNADYISELIIEAIEFFTPQFQALVVVAPHYNSLSNMIWKSQNQSFVQDFTIKNKYFSGTAIVILNR